MQSYPYVHLRIPGRGRLTLSPGGVRRGLESGRLPPTADVWLAPIGAWIPLTKHKGLARLQSVRPVPAVAVEEIPTATMPTPLPPHDDLAIERFSADHLIVSENVELREEPLVSRMVLASKKDEETEAESVHGPLVITGAAMVSPWRLGNSAIQSWASSL